MISAKSSAASFGYAWAAGVKVPTPGISSSTPTFAMDAVVGFATVPPAPSHGANEEQADAGQHINTGNKQSGQRCANCAPGLETGQPPGTVRGDVHRQRVATRTDAHREASRKKRLDASANFFRWSFSLKRTA
jgi:hypothetical protein